MCGRYIFYDGKTIRLQKLIELAQKQMDQSVFNTVTLGEVYPSCRAFAGVFHPDNKLVITTTMVWGFTGTSGKQVINARSETASSSPFFAGSRTCVLPATSYFEWSADRKRYQFASAEEPFYLGGLCRRENNDLHFVILTENAAGDFAYIHPRQPVIFTYEDAKRWCASMHSTPDMIGNSVQKRILLTY